MVVWAFFGFWVFFFLKYVCFLNVTGFAHLRRSLEECSRLTHASSNRGKTEFYLSAVNPLGSHTQISDFPVPAWSILECMVYPQLKQTVGRSPHRKVAPLSSRRLQARLWLPEKAQGFDFVSKSRLEPLGPGSTLHIEELKRKYVSPSATARGGRSQGREMGKEAGFYLGKSDAHILSMKTNALSPEGANMGRRNCQHPGPGVQLCLPLSQLWNHGQVTNAP